jgi:hypothetical protein
MGRSARSFAYGPGALGNEAPVLGSMLTRQYRFATRGIHKTLETTCQAIDVAGGIALDVADRLGLHNGHSDSEEFSGEVVSEAAPSAARPVRKPSAATTPAPPPASAQPAPPEPEPTPAPAPLPLRPEPSHVSAEPELVESFSEPGAEDGAGAEVHIGEPWPGYRHLKARDVIARLPSASREELAAVELFERAGANRKSVVVAAERALKKASPPR